MLCLAPAVLQAQGPQVEHKGVGCIVAGRYPRLDACFDPVEEVAQARAYFRTEGSPAWYFVEMKRDPAGRCHAGILPKPGRRLVGKKVQYYLEAADRKLAVGRTEEHDPVVVRRAMECRQDPLAAPLTKAAVKVYPAMPAGFSAGGAGLLVPAAVLGVVGAGVGTGAALGGGERRPSPVSTTPTTVAVTTPTTSSTTTTTLPPANRPPLAAFRVNPDPPAGLAPLAVQFNMCPSTDPDGDALQFRFDFGDGSSDRGPCRIDHRYPAIGTFVAALCVTDGQPGHELCQTFSVRVTTAPPPPAFVLTVAKAGTGAGTVTSNPAGIDCGLACSAGFGQGTAVTLSAVPAGGSTFAGWNGAGCTGAGACVVTMTAAQNVTATFDLVPVTFPLTVTKAGTGTGTVTSTPPGIDCGPTCVASFPSGTPVTLNAVPTGGSTFAGWSGAGCTGIGVCIVTMTAAQNVTATFNPAAVTFPLTVTKAGTGTGTVTSTPPGIDCGPTCVANFPNGTPVTLNAVATGGSTFAGWSGAGCTGIGVCTVTMTAAQNVTATFNPAAVTFPLTVTKAGPCSLTVTSSPPGIDCGPTCAANFASGSQVTLTTPLGGGGCNFVGWSGAGCAGTGVCVVDMIAAQNVTATYAGTPNFLLSVNKAGTGAGTVTSNPGPIDCGATCSASYASGTPVVLTAVAAGGSNFAGWSGGGCSGIAPCSVTMNADVTVTATFNTAGPTLRTLTVNRSGNGNGTVSSSPPGIACGTDCSEVYNQGTPVTLSAVPSGGSSFGGWSGGGCSGTADCNLTINADITVDAQFDITPTFQLNVNLVGTGGGFVSGPGINCPGDCSESYSPGTQVDLSAMPDGASSFAGWGGDCSGGGLCSLTMNGNRNVNAAFTPGGSTVVLTVSVAGLGVVNSNPPGITDCSPFSGSCSASFLTGSQVNLTATPAVDFILWGGACSGTNPNCSVIMNVARTVTATFQGFVAGSGQERAGSATSPKLTLRWRSELLVSKGKGVVRIDQTARPVGRGESQGTAAVAAGEVRIEGVLVGGAAPGLWRFHIDEGALVPGSLRGLEGTVAAVGGSAIEFRLQGQAGERVSFAFRTHH